MEFSFGSDCLTDNVNYLPISYWLGSEFSPLDQEHIIKKIGNWSFYKSYESTGLDKLEFLEFIEKSFKAKRDKHIYDQAIEKLKIIAPKEFGCDPKLFATDEVYRAWFARREDFLKSYQEALSDTYPNLKWMAVVDNLAPDICRALGGKVFKKDDPALAEIVHRHWAVVKRGCRCGIRITIKC